MNRKERLLNVLVYIKENKDDFNKLFAKLNEEIFTEELESNRVQPNQYLNSLMQTKENSAYRYQNALSAVSLRRSGYLKTFITDFDRNVKTELNRL